MASFTGSKISEKQDAHHGRTVNIRDVDIAAGLDSDKPLGPDIAAHIRYVHPCGHLALALMSEHLVGAKLIGTSCHLCAVRYPHLSGRLTYIQFTSTVMYL